MAHIRYKNTTDLIPAIVMPVTEHIVRITTDNAPNTSGFNLFLDNSTDYPLDNGEYESYTTLYRQGEEWFELSDDGSVYQEPSQQPVEELAGLSEEEIALQNNIAQTKAQIADLKSQLGATDYQIIKMYEYSMVGVEQEYDATAIHTARQALRDQINTLEQQLDALTTQQTE